MGRQDGDAREPEALRGTIALRLRSPDFKLTPGERAYVEKHLAARLAPHARWIRRVVVFFRDVNGTRGGEDKICRIEVILPGAPIQVVEETDHDVRALTDRAVDRLERMVRDEVQRRRTEPRQRGRRLIRALELLAWR